MICAILVLLELATYLIYTIPYLFVLWIRKKINFKKGSEAAQRGAAWILRRMARTALGDAEFRVEGLENIPRDRAVLFVSNHRSYFDIITSYPVLPVQTGYIAKDTLGKIPSMRQWMELLNCLFLNRDDIRQGVRVIQRATELVKGGTSIWICPEGTRNKNRDNTTLLEFHEASFKIAERSGCPIVPVAFYGTDRVWEAQYPKMRPYPVTIRFGRPFTVKELGPQWKRKTAAYTAEVIRKMLVEEKDRREAAEVKQ